MSSGEEFFYINKNYKHPITSKRILESWSFPFIIDVEPETLLAYKKAKPLGFRDGTLVRGIADGKLYLISQRLKRPVGNPDFLLATGVKKIQFVSEGELRLHADGEVIN